MTISKETFCRICEPGCPIKASFNEQGKVEKLSPNPDHPGGGTPCHKGLSYLEIHNSPDRLNWPMRRNNSRTEPEGQFDRISWDQAFSEMGEKLRTLRDLYGPNAIAFYRGNPAAFDSRSLLVMSQLMQASGSQMLFSSSTQDMSNKARVAADIYGSISYMVPDIINTDYLLCIGGNPKVSHWTVVVVPNDALDVLKKVQDRGGKVRFVNPRRIESSSPETGETVRIKPGTDVYLLAALLHEIRQHGGIDEAIVQQYGKNTDGLFSFVTQYPADKVEGVTGIPADEIRQMAVELMAAKSAAVYISTGVNMSRQGVLAFWLSEMINFVTGNLGKEGGSYSPTGFYNKKTYLPMAAMAPVETSIGEFQPPVGAMVLPGVALPDLINSGEIKALITLSGNPLMSIAGESKMRSAFEKLDLMVNLDIARNGMVEMADYALPSSSWIERADINFLANGLQIGAPFVHYTDAMELPAAERREDWWILSRLAQELGVPSLLDDPDNCQDGFATINTMLATSKLSVDQLKVMPHQTVMLESRPKQELYENCLRHPDKKIDCCPSTYSEAGLFERCATIFEELEQAAADQLRMITLRTNYMHNSWFSNAPSFRKGMTVLNPLHMCSEDASKRGLFDGDPIEVYNDYGRVKSVLRISDDMMPGVVAMSHGYGHHHATGLAVESHVPGANYNQLLPTEIDSFEPLSHMAWMSGVPVLVVQAEQVS